MDRAEIVKSCFEKKILINKDLLNSEKDFSKQEIISSNSSLLVLNKDIIGISTVFDGLHLDKLRVGLEKKQQLTEYNSFIDSLKKENTQPIQPMEVSISFENTPKKYEIKDFSNFFVSRYKFMEGILRNRQELSGILSINRIINKNERGNVSFIGMVSETRETRTGSIIIELEDLTGQIRAIATKNKPDIIKIAKDLIPDEVVGVCGTSQGDVVFVDKIIWPEFPVDKELKKYDQEIYSIFLSDVHVGSTDFLEKEFKRFLSWLKGETGNEKQKKISQNIKYIFIVGDVVDGIGIYPNQDKELEIKDIYKQYEKAAEYIKQIPKHIQVIICPGNHDALHLAEPQPAFNPKYVQPLLDIPNVKLVSNPSTITICANENFSGFDVLLYHGYSFDYYVANVDSIRNQGGYNRADLIMKFLLKRRHLAPSYTSTPYLPVHKEDPLLIKKIPDFFITGHIHYSIAANYRNITLISGSCWQSKTSFQEKVGHEPQPARVPIVNLKTREIKIIKFI